MGIIEHIVGISNFYEKTRQYGTKSISEFFQKNNITLQLLSTYLDYIKKELTLLQEFQDERNYEQQIKSGEKFNPNVGESIISNEFVANLLKMDDTIFKNNSKSFKYDFESVSIIAYKYELKFARSMLDLILIDSDLWSKLELH